MELICDARKKKKNFYEMGKCIDKTMEQLMSIPSNVIYESNNESDVMESFVPM